MAALFVSMYAFADVLTMSIVYLWSQLHKDDVVNFIFGLRFKVNADAKSDWLVSA
jgi:small basic protein